MRLFCLLFISLIPLHLFSQSAEEYRKADKAITNCPQHIITMPARINQPNTGKTTLPVGKIEVKDVREDTSYIGIQIRVLSSWANHKCRKILFDKPLSSAFSGFLNGNADFPTSESPYSLVCFVKEFRITQKDSVNSKSNRKVLYNRIAFNADVFLKHNDDYFPAFKVDTIMLGLIEEVNEFGMIPELLIVTLQKCALMNVLKTEAKHSYTLTALKERYSQSAKKPILTASNPEAGIYASYEEFVNNKPSMKKYELKSDKKSTSLYAVSPGGELILQTKSFGFCDGAAIWLHIANEFYPLIRRQNTFEYIGDYYAVNNRIGNLYSIHNQPNLNTPSAIVSASAASILLSHASEMASLKNKVVHQLNLETGEIY